MKQLKNDKAQWIWHQDPYQKNQWVMFKKIHTLNQLPEKTLLNIAVDSKYWLYINGECVVYEGGLNRGPFPEDGYIDVVDINKYLKLGDNLITVLVWYWGNEGRNNVSSGQAGFLLFSDQINLYSDASWHYQTHPSYQETLPPHPAYLFGGYNIGYDAQKETSDLDVATPPIAWPSVSPYGTPPQKPWGNLYERPIPPWKTSVLSNYTKIIVEDGKVVASLPYATHISPYFEVEALGGEMINIQLDRYEVNGGPGEEHKIYLGHRIEYICKEGINTFEGLYGLFGEKVIYTFPDTVQVHTLKYREIAFDSDTVPAFSSNEKLTDILIEKSARTLLVCMRDNFMDCPDREKGQWIGDVSVQVPQVFYLLDRKADTLVEKAISDFIHLRKGDVLVGNVPGVNFIELPAQSLNAISMIGMISIYYQYTKDKTILETAFEPMVSYLKLWQTTSEDTLVRREGDWDWYDHLENVDRVVLEYAWYYSALTFIETVGKLLKQDHHDPFVQARKRLVEKQFPTFWKKNFYSSTNTPDERANAMAVLSGLAPKSYYEAIKEVLIHVEHASPYMENYILDALCEMGYKKEAHDRALRRYDALIQNDNTTLWENFDTLGTKNHAWSGGPATMYYKHFAGIKLFDFEKTNIEIKPNVAILKDISCEIETNQGMLKMKVSKTDLINIEIDVAFDNVELILDSNELGIKQIISINDEPVLGNSLRVTLPKGHNRWVVAYK